MLGTRMGQVPQGSPISSDILNFYLSACDEIIGKIAVKLGAKYGRTYDDHVISSNSELVGQNIVDIVEANLDLLGLKISENKREKIGLQQDGQIKKVHNLVVNSPLGVGIPPEQQTMVYEMAMSYKRGAKTVGPEQLDKLAIKRERIMGYIQHFRQSQISNVKMIWQLIRIGDNMIDEKLRKYGLIPHKNKWWLISRNRGICIRNEPRILAKLWTQKIEAI